MNINCSSYLWGTLGEFIAYLYLNPGAFLEGKRSFHQDDSIIP